MSVNGYVVIAVVVPVALVLFFIAWVLLEAASQADDELGIE